MTCKCIEEINLKLMPHNTRIKEPFFVITTDGVHDKTRRVFVESEQIAHGRGKLRAKSIFASFCPFCGVAYESAVIIPEGTLTTRDDVPEGHVEIPIAWPHPTD